MTAPLVEAVPAALAGQRVDRFVAMLTGLARGEIADLVAAGGVRVEGRSVSRSRRLVEGDRVEVDLPAPAPSGLQADGAVEVVVVHADQSVIVVDKPAGLVVHPGSGHDSGTLVHGLLARFPDLAEVGPAFRPGIVHRLDKGTSGLMVVARTVEAHASLVAQLHERLVERVYLALVIGSVEASAGVVDGPLGRSERDPTRMAIAASGKEARTRYRVVERFTGPEPCTLVECRLETGRTHQIRVHLAAIGHHVVGDSRYGRRLAGLVLDRPFLHATALTFDHPATGQRVSFTSPLPADLVDFRHALS